MSAIELIVGLGNPGRDYEQTRHNAGAWLVQELARRENSLLKEESKFFARCARLSYAGADLRLLIPTTFMNHSGRAVGAYASFYKIPAERILVAYDELDFEPGTARFKTGGSASHNGLKDITAHLGNNRGFHRLRIGIGHPGSADRVTGHVLSKPAPDERESIEAAIDAAIDALPHAIAGDWARAMHQLHSFQAP